MIPQFFVFVEDDTDPIHLALIKGLFDHDYFPFVDSKNGNNQAWFDQNLKSCPHMIFYLSDQSTRMKKYSSEDEFKKPDLLVAFSEGVLIDSSDWDHMYFLIKSMNCLDQPNKNPSMIEEALKRFEKPLMVKPESVKQEKIDLPTSYAFRFASVGDVGFYEIIKPNVIEPYVTMVEDYKNHPMDMYTNWFKCTSWGVSNADVSFMYQLWKHHGEEGILDLEKEYEKRVQRVLDGEKEPLVWRNSLENVIEIYEHAQSNTSTRKRKNVSFEMCNKK